MNTRIRELMAELKKTVSTHRGAEVLIGHDEIEKFAELIVRECAEVCIAKYYYSDQMSKQCGINFAKDIKQHFGVEE